MAFLRKPHFGVSFSGYSNRIGKGTQTMHHGPLARIILACGLAIATTTATINAQYSLTVNRDRLVNAQNEPQNWLIMNGDYNSIRYSKLTQINRENVGGLRMAWALALGGM